jgi:hypothetical protein
VVIRVVAVGEKMTKSTAQEPGGGIRAASLCLALCLMPLLNVAGGSPLPPTSVRDFERAPNSVRDFERDRSRDQRDPRDQQDDRWNCRPVTISEFKAWVAGFMETLEGGQPSRRQWGKLREMVADIEEAGVPGRRKCRTE